ncbi:glyoxylase-like metal-dependent hydrolase (beta-lactamase superfamily II) [Kribbella amoyensis]|uniref:Glyoxylase-like metal-dependent hydrolase (Beta-lactamase superfamily II) n=1 Tax=Kribbella amoyensis TaxID=996641 RepID=A0A561BNL2_9ACTN|nr:MBL fold metallo-hydrolase [Kribbella amoyensis]TWD80434.1 glyoxylase-like metal-dependent hydrolase (beta-lactamase superfamily II) [Kribbella amoyensis]
MDVTVLCDAVAVFPEPIEDALPGWSAEHQAWTAANLPGNVAPDGGWLLHFHSYLVTTDGHAILVDTGIGPAGGEAAEWLGTPGRLPQLLTTAGVEPEEIDTVILTHIHLDHAGWTTSDDRPRFPRATYVVQQAEADHARPGTTYRNLIAPIAEAGQLRTVDGETTVAGLKLLPTPGHTPGHQAVLTDQAILAGDTLVHPAQARRPELPYVYERDVPVAITSRRTLLTLARTTGLPLAAAHPHVPLAAQPDGTITAQRHSTTRATACPPHRL